MTWIEGVGDEVTVFFVVVTIVLVISLAWLSTGIRDIPFISVIIIELTTRRRRITQTNNQDTPTGQTLEVSSPETDPSTGDISQTEEVSLVQEGHGVQGHEVQESHGVQEDHEGQGLQEESTEIAERQDNLNLKEILKGQNDSGKRSKSIDHSGVTLEGFSVVKGAKRAMDESQEYEESQWKGKRAMDESQEYEEKMLKTELSGTELRHRRMTFFDKANKLDTNESESRDLTFRDLKLANSSQPSGVENSSMLENKQILPSDVEKDSSSACGIESVRSGNGAKPVIPDSVSSIAVSIPVIPDSLSPVVVSNDDRPVMDNLGLRVESESDAEQPSTTPESENVTTQPHPDGYTEVNVINTDSSMIRIRLKYFNDSLRLVSAYPTDTVENFRRTHFSVELSENKLIRFIFNGQELRINSSTLQAYNIVDNSVIHCLISQNPVQTDATHTSDDDFGFDMGVFMFPLFGFLLAIIWYFRFTYRQFFNVTSTLSLGGITFLFLAALCASLRRRHGHEHLE